MSLRNLFESVFNEDYKSNYNDYIDLGKKTDRQTKYVKDKAKNTNISTSSGPIKFTYSFDDAFDDWQERGWNNKYFESKGVLSIYINSKLAWSSDKAAPETYVAEKFFTDPNLSLMDILGQSYRKNPEEQQAFYTLLNAMMSYGLSLPQLEKNWKEAYGQAVEKFNRIKARTSGIENAIRNRQWQSTLKYMDYTKDIYNLDNLKVGDKVHYFAKYGKEGEKDWQDGTILKISNDRKVFTIKSDYGWTNTIKNNGDNITIDSLKGTYTYDLSDEDKHWNDEKKYK